MKKWLLVFGLVICLHGTAEAGVGGWIKNTWSYLWTPVNCVAQLAHDMGIAVWHTATCVLSNANRNPVTLDPVFTVQ